MHFSLGKKGLEIFKEAIGDVPIKYIDGLEMKHIPGHLYVDSDSPMLGSIKHQLYPIATRMVAHLLKVSLMKYVYYFYRCQTFTTIYLILLCYTES